MLTLTLVLPLGQPTPGTEFAYVLSARDGEVAAHGVAPLATLPQANLLVAVVPAQAVSWHAVAMPPLPPGRQRAALEGLLEEHLLDEPAQLAFAQAPWRLANGSVLVAAFERRWIGALVALFENADRPIGRLVAEFSPQPDGVHPTRWHVTGTAHDPRLVVVRSDGVLSLPLAGASAVFGPRLVAPGRDPVLAEPAVAELAEQWCGQPVQVQPLAQRLVEAGLRGWDLAQFDLALTLSGRMARRWQRLVPLLRSPQWRMARWGALALVVVQLVGLNAWAWKLDTAVRARQQQIRAVVTQTFPQVRTVVDAPVQMQRQLDLLRQQGGGLDAADLEAMLAALGAALPPNRHPAEIAYAPGELRLRGLALDDPARDRLREALASQGYRLQAEGERLLVRPGSAP